MHTVEITQHLVTLRRFVNAVAPRRSERAFKAILQSLTRRGDDPRAVAVRRVAYGVLSSDRPLLDVTASRVPYAPLTSEQVAR